MAEATTVTVPISGTDKTLTFETGKLAPQSQGAVTVRIGDTVVLVTANMAKNLREGQDFFPLTVDIEERKYAVGKIPGSVFRREGAPGDEAVLLCRLIDRPLRPSFPKGFRNEVHVVGMPLAADQVNPHDVICINAASAALMLSGMPFDGPIGAVRVAYTTDGKWIPHPTYQDGDASTFELVVAGRRVGQGEDAGKAGDIAIMMVEAGSTEIAWEAYENGAPKVTEDVIAQGLEESKTWIREAIEAQDELVAKAGRREDVPFTPQPDYSDEIYARVAEMGTEEFAKAAKIADKVARNAAFDEAGSTVMANLNEEFPEPDHNKQIRAAIRSLTKAVIRRLIVDEGVRMDGRGTNDLRALSAEVGVLPVAHGSGLFQRGETQVLNVLALGMPRMAMEIPFKDSLDIQESKRYMHHYYMPPFSNGETGRLGRNRRATGHGMLAERAVTPVVPPADEFPYAMRLVSEVLSSNGSTSMASVCASSLALMDAGVPIKAPVAGIAMGLIHEEGKYITLTDILGSEDAFGDMDFKVAGTADFVTALQLDTKIEGLPADVLKEALGQAKEARLQILEVMNSTISEARSEVRETAPKIVSFEIPMDKIGEIIGPKGKVINQLQLDTGADINVDDDGTVGTVTIGSKESTAVNEARRRIELILDPPKAEVGAVYQGVVVNITKFGAFVNILPGRDGLLHVSKLGRAFGKRIERVEDVLELNQPVNVKVDDVDPGGKVSLDLVDENGDPMGGGEGGDFEESAPRSSDRGDRGGRESRGGDRGGRDRGDRGGRESRGERAPRAESSAPSAPRAASFEDTWESEAKEQFGDLGTPGGRSSSSDGGDGPRRNPRRGGGGGDSRRR
ncbi:MAG TPA: polyribonucleotide nucleotidyltransferase [Acidimicrobiales bacterium]|nr:polyribonucleotide nucleotidyltransferase [Acidimicrobiales bacterium]